MPVFQHLQQVKQSVALPMAANVNTCITCHWWDAESPRPQEEADMVGLCHQPQLDEFGLIVAGKSGCNHWEEQPDVGPEAMAYNAQGEAQA